MNSVLKGLLCVIKGLSLTILFGYVLESVINDKTYVIILVCGVIMLFISTYIENELGKCD